MKHKFEEGTAVRIFDIIYTYGSSTTIYIYGCDGIILTYRGVLPRVGCSLGGYEETGVG